MLIQIKCFVLRLYIHRGITHKPIKHFNAEKKFFFVLVSISFVSCEKKNQQQKHYRRQLKRTESEWIREERTRDEEAEMKIESICVDEIHSKNIYTSKSNVPENKNNNQAKMMTRREKEQVCMCVWAGFKMLI